MSSIKISIVTPNSEVIEDTTEFVVVKTDEGEIGFLKDHTPLIGKISNGFCRLNDYVVAIKNGILDFNNNVCNIICQDSYKASTYDEAIKLMEKRSLDNLNKSKMKLVDFTEAEKDLVKSIKEASLGRYM